MINFAKRQFLLAGMHYAGERKKDTFSVAQFLLTEKKVMQNTYTATIGIRHYFGRARGRKTVF